MFQPKKYVKYDVEYNDKDPKFEVGDRMKISKYKKVFGKGYTPSWCEKVFVIKKVRKHCTMCLTLLLILQVTKLLGHFFKKRVANHQPNIIQG